MTNWPYIAAQARAHLEALEAQEHIEDALTAGYRRCLNCRIEFAYLRSDQWYCCDKCREQKRLSRKRLSNPEKAPYINICPVCTTAFETSSLYREFCSPKCRLTNHRNMKRMLNI